MNTGTTTKTITEDKAKYIINADLHIRTITTEDGPYGPVVTIETYPYGGIETTKITLCKASEVMEYIKVLHEIAVAQAGKNTIGNKACYNSSEQTTTVSKHTGAL